MLKRLLRPPVIPSGRTFSSKIQRSSEEAVRDISNGQTLLIGGFGLSGCPENLLRAIQAKQVKNLTLVSNNCGLEDFGLGILIKSEQVKRMVASFVGGNKHLESQYLTGQLELELIPQGNLAEKIRCGGAGIAGFYTPTGANTIIHSGGFPIKLKSDGKTPEIVT
jgi:3-oxoacid CoA-transferase A subunit